MNTLADVPSAELWRSIRTAQAHNRAALDACDTMATPGERMALAEDIEVVGLHILDFARELRRRGQWKAW